MSTAPAHYRTHAQAYFDATHTVGMAPLYARFLPLLPAGGRVLDAGCGSGRDALAFAQKGFDVEAFDASPELAALARAHTGLSVQVMAFEHMAWQAHFDGIWACASLLHVPPLAQADVWQRLLLALKPSGVLYASYKLGEGEAVDAQGRHFTHATAQRVASWLPTAPLSQVLQVWHSADQRPGVEQAWLNVLVLRLPAHDHTSGSSSGP
jgi:SAM-dependent methyltransferase